MDTMRQTEMPLASSRDYAQLRDMRKEGDTRSSRERVAVEGEMDRVRTRERLEATLAGLGELEYLRQRQELLVRNALNSREETTVTVQSTGDNKECHLNVAHEGNYLSTEEKLLEENILLLRKQLNCLRRRDAGLINQLQELDRQISDLRLDTEVSHDHAETDSRPSSGFYELSDGASGSLSNSSNSVFSECLSSCRSSTCFCSPLDTSLCSSDGRLRSTDEPGSCAECEALVGGLFDDQASSGTVRRSLSAPYPHSLDPSLTSEAQSKYHCDLVARNGSDVYRYPSPLHAVAVQSPIFFQSMSGGHGKDEGHGECFIEGQKLDPTPPPPPPSVPPVSAPLVPQSTSWPAPFSSSSSSSSASSNFTPSHKRLENYIYSLLQRRALPIRTNKPRTSINTDPSKSILRQASLCVRQGPGLGHGTLRGSELKTNWQTCVPPGGVGNFESTGTSSPRRQWSVESKGEEQENGGIGHLQGQTQNGFSINNSDMAQNGYPINNTDSAQNLNGYSMSNSGVQHGYLIHNVVQNGYSMNNDIYMNTNTNSLLKKKGLSSASKGLLPPSTTYTTTLPKDYKDLGSPNANSSPKETKQPCYPVTATIDQELPVKSPQIIKTQSATPKQSPKPLPHVQSGKGDRSVPELISLGSSSQSQDEGGGSGGGGSRLVSAHYIPAQRQAVRLRKGGGKSIKIVKVKSTASIKASRASAHAEPVSDTVVVRGGDKQQQSLRSGSKKSGLPEEASSTHHKVSKRGVGGASGVSSSKIKRIPVSIPEGRVLDKQATSTVTSVSTGRSGVSRQHHGHHGNHHHNGSSHHGHHHHHGRDSVVVVAKPKHKRNDYRRLRAITEVPYEEAFRRAQRRQRRELLSQTAANVYLPASGQYTSPYAYVAGSDSEYSAECASLFHSTIMDTSEDEKSNYTTNCFGDSESSVSEVDFVGESSTTTDSEESGGGGAGGGTGGAGRGWTQAGGQQMTPAQAKAFVKIKASHNLKKRILRFRSGSLKLMTTV